MFGLISEKTFFMKQTGGSIMFEVCFVLGLLNSGLEFQKQISIFYIAANLFFMLTKQWPITERSKFNNERIFSET